MRLAQRAPAKVNLCLHVLGRRPDGYHELESLVAFAGVGDYLQLVPKAELSLVVDGPTAQAVGPNEDNLVLRAARALEMRVPGLELGAFHLVKRLPVSAGLGGGSSDAAAALRLLTKLNGLALDHPALAEAAESVGADVPVCLAGRARMMTGVGERLGPLIRLPLLFALLVNPGVPAATADVFRALNAGPIPLGSSSRVQDGLLERPGQAALFEWLTRTRNDLEQPATGMTSEIAQALAALRRTRGCRIARMSGSGATVFGLYEDRATAALARAAIAGSWPLWWVRATMLR